MISAPPEPTVSPRPFVIDVAGGTGCGKTTVSQHIQAAIAPDQFAYLQHDNYYHDQSARPPTARAQRNYDRPESLDTPLLVQHLEMLCRGQSVNVPLYDFATHTRATQTVQVKPARVILLEGILILAEPALRNRIDMRIFVDTDADIRFIRRLHRDMRERGRTIDSIINQYLSTVRPMHLEFVEPSKRYAHVIVPEGGNNRVAMEMIASRIKALLG